MATTNWTQAAALIGMVFALVAGLTVALFAVSAWMPNASRRHRWLAGVGIWGIVFQVVHFAEHAIQFGYWMGNPNEKPYLSPWAFETAQGLAYWCAVIPGSGLGPARGNEVMHLLGNIIFLIGMGAFYLLARDAGLGKKGTRAVRWGFWLEAFHVVEHVALTATFFASGTARGISTVFGVLDPASSFTSQYRLIWHFVMNLIATIFGIMAYRELRHAGALGRRPADRTTAAPSIGGIAPAGS